MTRKKVSQRLKIKRALERGERLTARACVRRWACYRAAARVKELRDDGMDIRTDYKSRLGVRFGVYYLAMG